MNVEKVAAGLRMVADALMDSTEANCYTSYSLPPDVRTRRAFASLCSGIHTAQRRGHCWVVSKADWEQNRNMTHAAPSVAPAIVARNAMAHGVMSAKRTAADVAEAAMNKRAEDLR